MKAGIDRKHFRVVIFGSARIEKGDCNWELIYHLAERIAEEGMDLVTSGGPGLMDAASQGHYRGDTLNQVHSIGLQILMPDKQIDAEHLDLKNEVIHFPSVSIILLSLPMPLWVLQGESVPCWSFFLHMAVS